MCMAVMSGEVTVRSDAGCSVAPALSCIIPVGLCLCRNNTEYCKTISIIRNWKVCFGMIIIKE